MNIRAYIYNFLITFTSNWYAAVLERLPENAHLLDIGIGTGKPIIDNAEIIKKKSIRITGIDIDKNYLEAASIAITKAKLNDLVVIQYADICSTALTSIYDAAYFSGSFMIIPKMKRGTVLQKVITSLSEKGQRSIYFTQTCQHHRSTVIAYIKPLLKWVTTIDFGEITYEDEFEKTLLEAGLMITERKALYTNKKQSVVLVATKSCI